MDELFENTRDLDGQQEKRNPQDFALWKNAPPEHIQRWASPWGEGFPGWHIECSAMSAKYLGEQFDIHGGGMDLQFPHHESEIAQSCICHNGTLMARYWLHNNMITINGRKMGKSYNNVIRLTELFSGNHPLLEQAYHPMTIRFFILQSHYRSTLDFGNDALQGSEKALKRLWEAYENLKQIMEDKGKGDNFNEISEDRGKMTDEKELDAKILKHLAEFSEFMNDDLNTAKVIASMFELAPIINGLKGGQIKPEEISDSTLSTLHNEMKNWLEDILGLQKVTSVEEVAELVLDELINLRNEARSNKNFGLSDAIRTSLNNIGITLKDSKNGETEFEYSNQNKLDSESEANCLIFFKTALQEVKIFLANDTVYCLLKSYKKNKTFIKWKMPLTEFLSILDLKTIKIYELNGSKRVDFGNKHKGWRINLFNTIENFYESISKYLISH
jgi:cysteinyl-tRNA synthetase